MSSGYAPVRIGILDDVPRRMRSSAENPSPGIDWMRVGLALALEEGLARGRVDRPFEIVERAAEGLPVGTAAGVEAAYRELAAAGVLAIIGPAITDNALVTRPIAEELRLPTMNWSGSERTRGACGFHYQLGSLPDEGPLLARWLVASSLGKLAVVRDRSPIADEYFEYFARAAGVADLEIVADVHATLGSDEQAVRGLERARRAEPQVLVCFGLGLAAPAIARARRTLGWGVPVATNTALLRGYTDPKTYWALFDGWVYVDLVDERNPVQSDLHRRLTERVGEPPAGPSAATGYDMGRLLVEGVAAAPELTREGVRIGLERVKGLPAACGGAGTVMGFGPWDHAALKGRDFLVLRRVTGGASRPLAADPSGGRS